ncbi:MAG TPA: NADP-dependent oxidoreductase [Nevskiaceae bacterium]|nr:NADP-dependent oxidoreductase [Nevskiaceae bacterium]
MNLRNRRWVLKTRPLGMPARSDFELREEPLPALADGQFLARNLYLSCDPAQRSWLARDTYVPKIAIGETMRAGATAQVVESRHAQFNTGDIVSGMFGWQDYAVSDGSGFVPVSKLPAGVPVPLAMSALGLTGLTAYYGMLEVAEVRAGQNVLVSGAAGATGSVAAQLAKMRGARVVGVAGGAAKCQYLLDQLRLDGAIDYRAGDVGAIIREMFPKGVDIYFDNTGGEVLEQALLRLSTGGRIVLCGAISSYNDLDATPPLKNWSKLLVNRGRVQGILVTDFAPYFARAAGDLARWVAEGKIKNRVDIVEGLEQAPDALRRLFTGDNIGKQLVKLAEPAAG